MYQAYYRLRADPFRLSPDHAFCYRYPSFSKGRAYMQYALNAAEGFVVVTGRPGMGKTTLINDLLADFGTSDYLVATLVTTLLDGTDLLRTVAYEFGINVEGVDKATLLQRLKQLLIRGRQGGRPPLLVVDEAQNLSLQALEELRLLTNLQLNGKPLLQIFLVGQENLRDKLADPSLEQLRQRITAATHLEPLTEDQTAAYIVHRLRVVGWDNFPKLKSSVLPVIQRTCEGVPRRINQFCSRLLLYGSVEEKAELNGEDARIVATELGDERLSSVDAARNTSEFGGVGGLVRDDGPDESIVVEAEPLLRQQGAVARAVPNPFRPHDAAPEPVPAPDLAVRPVPEPPRPQPSRPATREATPAPAADESPSRTGLATSPRGGPVSVAPKEVPARHAAPDDAPPARGAESAPLPPLPARHLPDGTSPEALFEEGPARERRGAAKVLAVLLLAVLLAALFAASPYGQRFGLGWWVQEPTPRAPAAEARAAAEAPGPAEPADPAADASRAVESPATPTAERVPNEPPPSDRVAALPPAEPVVQVESSEPPADDLADAALPDTASSASEGGPASAAASSPTQNDMVVEAPMPIGNGPPAEPAPPGVPVEVDRDSPSEPPAVTGPPEPVALPPVESAPLPGHAEIAFAFDSAEIDDLGREALDRVGAVLSDRAGLKARIVGYTDNVGPRTYNAWLSRRRAEAVAAYLERRGVETARLEVLAGDEPDGQDGADGSGRIVRIEFLPEA